ncbi:hypothetical protein [Flavobacterium sp. UMI-01]|uniref:hypothetical protein n=1 Tax=Flavobacterium sp. UMI-01 TaxID=1441053 RepID=UPI001C7D81CB|nr:hypothetical protein [Flavobacterium sp. UMI-01]GIZ09818.1 hypothetical protein FUMI01_25450 [Flavobacterium sp. UMI-01]
MKKILLLFSLLGIVALQSCTDEVDNDTISEVFEREVSFTSANNYSNVINLTPAIFSSDVVLVYRLSGVYQGADVWKLLPESFYFNNGTLDFGYRYDFTKYDVNIYMVGNDLQSVSNEFRMGQVFRIVIVPASFSTSVDVSNYNEVISALNVKENEIKKVEF